MQSVQALTTASSTSSRQMNAAHVADGWDWPAGSFDLEQVLVVMCEAMHGSWASWLDGGDLNKQAAFDQLVGHVMTRQLTMRSRVVSCTKLQWEALETAGIAYLSRPRASSCPPDSCLEV